MWKINIFIKNCVKFCRKKILNDFDCKQKIFKGIYPQKVVKRWCFREVN